MILLVEFSDGTEESFDVPAQTKLQSLLKNEYWTFSTVDGGQVALSMNAVVRIEMGNVNLVDQELSPPTDKAA